MSAVPAPGSVTTIFIVAGEHSGDALGAKLMAGLKTLGSGKFRFAGVGGHEMEGEGLVSLFPIEDVAVMGPLNILKALPRLRRRVLTTVDAAIAAQPHIPIIDYVSPSVWAWRPGRAKKMRAYVDEILALLPFEPEAHERLGGPHCTYVGHPLIERLPDIASADAAALAARAGIALGQPVLLALPGSRRSEVERLVDVFGETVAVLRDRVPGLAVVIPAVAHVRPLIEARSKNWKIAPIIVDGHADKYAAMKLARAALAASGTVTLELALANLPMAVAYKVDPVAAPFLRRMIKAKTVVLANLVLGENAFPEFLQEDCNAARLANALIPLLGESPERRAQLAALARIPARVALPSGTPSEAAARAVLRVLGE
ncbi:MAG: lipid-A-disaccharide synthase [Hyphomicrobium sp.]